uniref:Sideroflexin-5 n=1 Tax=Heterorhabditis bacteriophora TaxID=37862 RepID=A0A1I7XT15_HETBA
MSSETLFGFVRYPPFNSGQPRFPQDSFFGRYLHYLDVIDPSTLLVSDKHLRECIQLLEDQKQGKLVDITDKQLWEAQKIKQAIIHPDTGDKILPPFRMSGYVPFGWITVTGMLLPNPSWPTLLFWQWMNQSHNACVNYANRNASQFTSLLGLTYLIKKSSSLSPTARLIIQRFVPLPATSLASSLNVICMRWNELRSGIEVYDMSGKVVGVSKRDKDSPEYVRIQWVRGSPTRHLLVNAIVCTLSFAVSLPVALALFPQEGKICVEQLEPELRSGTEAKILYYNKGL